MKRYVKYLLLVMSIFGINIISVEAKQMLSKDIEPNSYLIGTHVFTNATELTMKKIMLASKTIKGNTEDDMLIYYKDPWGEWSDGVTGAGVSLPEKVEVEYIDDQLLLESLYPVLEFEELGDWNGAISFDDNKQLFVHQLKLKLNNYKQNGDYKITKIQIYDITSGRLDDTLIKEGSTLLFDGNSYYFHAPVETSIGETVKYQAKVYMLDQEGVERIIYSNSITFDQNIYLPAPKISDINYVKSQEDYLAYSLTITPYRYTNGKVNSEPFFYEVDNVNFKATEMNKQSVIYVPKETKSTYHIRACVSYEEDSVLCGPYSDEFVIDTRTLTSPILKTGMYSSYSSETDAEYIWIDTDFYKKQNQNSLDYNVSGFEIYEVLDSTVKPWEKYNIISNKFSFAHVIPSNGVARYIARAYAMNEKKLKIYSDFSEELWIVRTPKLQVSDIIDGKFSVKVSNEKDYGYLTFDFEVYSGNTLLGTAKIGEELEIISEDPQTIYAKAVFENGPDGKYGKYYSGNSLNYNVNKSNN